jgi:CrcB protein
MFLKFILAGLGAFLGGGARFLISHYLNQAFQSSFLWGTVAVNILGCFLIGLVVGLQESRSFFNPLLLLFLTVGFLGGLTTFSSYALEVLMYFLEGKVMLGIIDILLQTLVGIAVVYLGYKLGSVVL